MRPFSALLASLLVYVALASRRLRQPLCFDLSSRPLFGAVSFSQFVLVWL